MMYSEFVAGTGCRDNEHNYKVFTDLEVMYMNSDLTKEQIYEYGKKLVDNRKSEKQLRFEAEVMTQIADYKAQIKSSVWYRNYHKSIGDSNMVAYYTKEIRTLKAKVAALKTMIEA